MGGRWGLDGDTSDLVGGLRDGEAKEGGIAEGVRGMG